MKNFSAYALRPLLDTSYEDKLGFVYEQMVLKKGALYFDWTASGLASRIIERRVDEILPYYANTHSQSSQHAVLFQDLYKSAKDRIRQILGLGDEFGLIACGSGASGAIKKFQELMGIYIPPVAYDYVQIKKELLPLVIVGGFEHHSNEISFREGLCEAWRIPLLDDFSFDLDALQAKLQAQSADRKIILSLNVLSNVTGNVAPYEKVISIVRKFNGIVALDMATSLSHLQIDASWFDACFLAPHKLLGGVGSCGILAIKKTLIDSTRAPSFAGGGAVKYVDRHTQIYDSDIEVREEAGTPPILQLFRAALAISLQEEIGQKLIMQKKRILMRILMQHLDSMSYVKVYGQKDHIGLLSFNINGISPFEMSYFLSQNYQIQTRAGCSCAGPYGHDLLGLKDGSYRGEDDPYGWLRVSLHYTHSLSDLEKFFEALRAGIRVFNPKLLES